MCVVAVLDDGPEEAHMDWFTFAKLLDVQSEIELVHLLDTEHGTSIVATSIDPSPVKYDEGMAYKLQPSHAASELTIDQVLVNTH